MSKGSAISVRLLVAKPNAAKKRKPKSTTSGATRRTASTMCLHILTGSLSWSSRETQANDEPAASGRRHWLKERRLPLLPLEALMTVTLRCEFALVLDQPGTSNCSGAGTGRSQLGLEDDTRRGAISRAEEWMILS